MKIYLAISAVLMAAICMVDATKKSSSNKINCKIMRNCATSFEPICGGTDYWSATFQNECIFQSWVCFNKKYRYRKLSEGACPVVGQPSDHVPMLTGHHKCPSDSDKAPEQPPKTAEPEKTAEESPDPTLTKEPKESAENSPDSPKEPENVLNNPEHEETGE